MSARAWSLAALGSMVWAVGAAALFSGSTVVVQFVAWTVGEGLLCGVALFVDKVRDVVWVPSEPTRTVPRDSYAEHQRHLADQARMAYLMNPNSQKPPPTDNFPGF